MRKNFFLTYGSLHDKYSLKDILEQMFDFDFKKHDSLYWGEYFKYSGLYADQIKIFSNQICSPYEDLISAENKHLCTIIKISITEGKNKDKLSKYKFIKKLIPHHLAELLKDELVSE